MLGLNNVLSLLKIFTATSIAYLDPGSGSFILQVLIASLVGIGFAFRGYLSKIKNLFRKRTQEDEPADNDDD